MRRTIVRSVALLIGMLGVLTARPGRAAKPLQSHGGPFLESFEICPLYYGKWSDTEILLQQAYLYDLAAYMSGENAPASQQPMTTQYGVISVTLGPVATAGTEATAKGLTRDELVNIIHTNQNNNNLAAFDAHRLIVVFPAHGFWTLLPDQKTGKEVQAAAYHSSESTSGFWAVVPKDLSNDFAVIAHEVFEASADPADDTSNGWDEPVDPCEDNLLKFSFGKIPSVADNTDGGACSKSGYTSLDETRIHGATFDDYKNEYDSISPNGWRLYILQPYVLANGDLRYNAVWRPAGDTHEKRHHGITLGQLQSDDAKLSDKDWRLYILQAHVAPNGDVLYDAVWRRWGEDKQKKLLGVTYDAFRSEYDTIFTASSSEKAPGWRLSNLQSYVLPSGEVRYDAVWRPGTVAETQVYGWTFADYKAKYDKLFVDGWRLYILDSYVIADGTVRYNAVWRQGTHAETQVYGWTFSDYKTKYEALIPDGWRIYILNAYVLPGGEVRYDAVWRKGTINRPL